MIDQLSHGRLELGIGKGSSPIEARMFDHAAEEMQARYDSFLPRILEALRTGTYRNDAGDEFPLPIRPLQSAFTTWYPTSNPESIQRAAVNGQHTIFGFAFKSPGLDVIRERRRKTGWDAGLAADAPAPPPVLLWQRAVHIPGIYDLKVDTSALSPGECAEIIRRRLADGPPPAAFPRLAAMAAGAD